MANNSLISSISYYKLPAIGTLTIYKQVNMHLLKRAKRYRAKVHEFLFHGDAVLRLSNYPEDHFCMRGLADRTWKSVSSIRVSYFCILCMARRMNTVMDELGLFLWSHQVFRILGIFQNGVGWPLLCPDVLPIWPALCLSFPAFS